MFHLLFTLAYNLSTHIEEEIAADPMVTALLELQIEAHRERKCFYAKEMTLTTQWRDLYKRMEFQNGLF